MHLIESSYYLAADVDQFAVCRNQRNYNDRHGRRQWSVQYYFGPLRREATFRVEVKCTRNIIGQTANLLVTLLNLYYWYRGTNLHPCF